MKYFVELENPKPLLRTHFYEAVKMWWLSFYAENGAINSEKQVAIVEIGAAVGAKQKHEKEQEWKLMLAGKKELMASQHAIMKLNLKCFESGEKEWGEKAVLENKKVPPDAIFVKIAAVVYGFLIRAGRS